MTKLISVEPKLIRNSIRVSGQFKFLDSQSERNRYKFFTTERPLHKIVSKIVKRQMQKKKMFISTLLENILPL